MPLDSAQLEAALARRSWDGSTSRPYQKRRRKRFQTPAKRASNAAQSAASNAARSAYAIRVAG